MYEFAWVVLSVIFGLIYVYNFTVPHFTSTLYISISIIYVLFKAQKGTKKQKRNSKCSCRIWLLLEQYIYMSHKPGMIHNSRSNVSFCYVNQLYEVFFRAFIPTLQTNKQNSEVNFYSQRWDAYHNQVNVKL